METNDTGKIIAIGAGSVIAVVLAIALGVFLARRHLRAGRGAKGIIATPGQPVPIDKKAAAEEKRDNPVLVAVPNASTTRNNTGKRRPPASLLTTGTGGGPPSPNAVTDRNSREVVTRGHVQVVVRYKPQTLASSGRRSIGDKALQAQRTGAKLNRVAKEAIEQDAERGAADVALVIGGEREEEPKAVTVVGVAS